MTKLAVFLITFAFYGNASLHPEMGPSHILDPDGILMDDKGWPKYASEYESFSPSPDYKSLQSVFDEIRRELKGSPSQKRRRFLEKMLLTTEKGLMNLYLRDRHIHAKNNKKVERYAHPESKKKSTQFFNRIVDKSGAVVWAHRQGVLGEGVDIYALETWGTLEKEGEETPRLASVIKSTQRVLPLGLKGGSDPRDEGLTHGAGVVEVLYQMAPQAQIYLIGDSDFSAIFYEKHFNYGKQKNSFPQTDIILNHSGGKGRGAAFVDHQIGHIKGFFEQRKEFRDLLVQAMPNSKGGYKPMDRDYLNRAKMKEAGYEETDPVFIGHILKTHGSQIILAGSMSKYGMGLRPFLLDDRLQKLAEERLLFAWGDEVLESSRGGAIEVKSGTSISAPIISGAAALLKSKYPRLTCAEAGEILLESAEKTFWNGVGVFVCDPEDFEGEAPEELGEAFAHLFGDAFVPKSEKIRLSSTIEAKPFSSALYGRGILNLRRAFIYGEVKEKHPNLTAKELKPLFKAAVREQEEDSIRTIQRAFRANIDKFKSRAGEAGKA